MDNTVMEACRLCGVNLRKHSKKIYSWGERVPTVIDLNKTERRVLESKGEKALDDALRKKGCFAFPALDIAGPRPFLRKTPISSLIIVCPEIKFFKDFSQKLKQLFSYDVPVVNDKAAPFDELKNKNLLVLGGSHQNEIARRLSYRNLSYADAMFPGKGGYILHSVCGFFSHAANITLLAFDPESEAKVISVLRKNIVSKSVLPVNEACPGPAVRKMFGDSSNIIRNICGHFELPGRSTSYNGLAKEIIKRYDSGGFKKNLNNGHTTIPNIVRIFHAYKITGDRNLLDVYKKTLWGLVEHCLNFPGGASYLSDYDFYLGALTVTWALAETEPVFNDNERLVISAVLLASSRQIERYRKAFWDIEPGKLRFNHETFPALSLYRCADYFTLFDIPDVKDWRKVARICFSGPVGKVFRHTENANLYQWIVPAHKLTYDLMSDKMECVKNGSVKKTAHAATMAVDNFGYTVDYGDAGGSITGGIGVAPFLDMVAAVCADNGLADFSRYMLKSIKNPVKGLLPHPGWGMTGIRILGRRKARSSSRWERLELDDHVRQNFNPDFPKRFVADKIAFRSSRNNAAQFLLFEPYSCDKHIHIDMNSVIRYNHMGRIWLVDNGYGKPCGIKNAALAFNRRQTGPEDHNLVIFRDASGEPITPPPFCAVTTLTNIDKKIFVLQSALCGIGGDSDWLRNIVLLKDKFILVVDQVLAGKELSSIECQWNCLGLDSLKKNHWTLEQDGILMHCLFNSPGKIVQDSYNCESWQSELSAGIYNFAAPPVKKLREKVDKPKRGERFVFVNLFAAGKGRKSDYALQRKGNAIIISGASPRIKDTNAGSLKISSPNKKMRIEFPLEWKLPEGLDSGMF